MSSASIDGLIDEYRNAQAYSLGLLDGLDDDALFWRPHANSSAIAWHLGHQAAVNHYMVRNLTAAEVTFDAAFDTVFDSATPEPGRGDLPPIDLIIDYRESIAESTERVVARIASGEVGAPKQLARIAGAMVVAIVNHEYQHATWIAEVRSTMTDEPAPTPTSRRLEEVEGYYMLDWPAAPSNYPPFGSDV